MELDARRARWLGTLALSVLALVVYLPLLSYPYVQDDWFVLALLDEHGAARVLGWYFDPRGQLFYRPFAVVWIATVASLSPASALPAHGLALALLVSQSVLLARIAGQLGATPRVAWAAATLHLLAVWVHRDPLSWMVGFCDLGALLFMLLAVTLELDRRSWPAALASALALLTKESAFVLVPGLLALMAWRGGFKRSLRAHVPVWAAYVVLRAFGANPFDAVAGDPYALSFARLGSGAVECLTWTARATLPLPASSSPTLALAAGVAALGGLAVLTLWAPRRTASRYALPGAVWLAGALVFPVLLANHRYAYYLSPAIPAVCLMLAWGLDSVARTRAGLVLSAYLGLRLAAATHEVWTRGVPSLDAPSDVGSNAFAAKAATVELARSAVTARSWPTGATLVIAGVDVWAFHANDGPRLWTGDKTLRVVDPAFVVRTADGFALSGAPANQADAFVGRGGGLEPLDPHATFALALVDGQLREVPLKELVPATKDR